MEKDSSSSSPLAKRRILEIEHIGNGTKKVKYNVGMSDSFLAEQESIKELTGVFADETNPANSMEFFEDTKALWLKNEIYGNNLDYAGNNTFLFGRYTASSGGALRL